MSDPMIGKKIGTYDIEKVLGQGGMGTVYLGVGQGTGRRVAIKTMLRTLGEDPEMASRFEREARVVQSIDHPNVARVFDSGNHEDIRYIVMELIEGSTVSEIIKMQGRISGSRALEIICQTVKGLNAALEAGAIHRDIKPDNIMVTGEGTVKILDFGLAKSDNPDSFKTATGAIMGTPHYLAPEQAMGSNVDFRADIYALGATFFHMLTGRPPFEAETAIAIIQKHIQQEVPAIQHLNPNVPEPVAQVVYRMMNKLPDERYQTYEYLIRVLEDLIAGKSLGAVTMTMHAEGDKTMLMQRDAEAPQPLGKKLLIAGVVLLALGGAAHFMTTREPEPVVQKAPEPGGLSDFKTQTVPMLHDINKAMREQDKDLDEFTSRRERNNANQ